VSVDHLSRGKLRGEKKTCVFSLPLLVFSLILGAGFVPPECHAQHIEGHTLSSFDHLAAEATHLNRRGKTDEVISLLEPHKADKENDSALFFNELGVAYRKKGRLEETIVSYRRALSLDPKNPVVAKNLADAYYFNKEYSRTVEECQTILRSNPQFHQAHFTLGMAYYRLGRHGDALEEFETVLKLKPGDEHAAKMRERLHRKSREMK
jgi:tetratricopeptide (TPR) repeat protein